ncbi:MAG: winged helix-turn-helix domain-containing protein [Xanthomonadales bacterium]|nr:winged helix-turn-helix domain-containing protein [Xanthomonadales bacterium]
MTSPPVYLFPPFRLSPARRELLCAGASIKLGGRAFDLLVALLERRDRIVGKGELLDVCWPGVVVEENNLQVQIVALRKLLGYAAIATIPGRGYRFTLPAAMEGGDAPATPAEADTQPRAAARDALASAGNLPTDSPTLIGRDEALLQLADLLDRFRLVTVAGAAGIGKTRLAQAVAMKRAASTRDGAWWVDLAPLGDVSHVPDAVAVALGLSLGSSADPTRTVMQALKDKDSLLVLDNAEHLLEGVVKFVMRLRPAAPGVRVLVTSQEPLRIDDECVLRPGPLSLPDGDAPERVAASGAVGLFVARAKAADRFFDLRADNQALVAEICRRLDGIPLAIELAAARLPLLGLEGLRDRLDQRFHVLTTGRRAALHRHQTLRAALDWSHNLLSIEEQVVLRRLAAFVGTFTLDAAQHVAEDEHGIDRWDVLEHLGALVDKSLVVAEGEPVPRYRLLETTRLFALERLIDSGEVIAVRTRHRDHFLFLAEACQPGLLDADFARDVVRLDLDRENLLAALAWAPGVEDAQLGLRLAWATNYYWFLRAMPRRGMEVARAALDRTGAQAPALARCRTLLMAGWLGMNAGEDDAAVAWLAEALLLARQLGDDRVLCHVLVKFATARHDRGETALAVALADEGLAVGRRLGDCIELGEALMQRAQAHRLAHEFEQAHGLFKEALALRRRIGNTTGAISSCTALAQLALDFGQPEAARAPLEEALAQTTTTDSQSATLHCIAIVAEWAAVIGHPETAVLLNASHERLASQAGMKHRQEPSEVQRIARARESLDAATVDRLLVAGSALAMAPALDAARAFVENVRVSATGAH